MKLVPKADPWAYREWLCSKPPEVTLINGGVTRDRPKLCVVVRGDQQQMETDNGEELTE